MIDLLPTNWKKYTLSELTTFYNGNSISKKIKQEKYSGLKAGRNYIATKDIGFDGTVCYENGIKIPYKETQFKTAPPGCVFVCSEGGSAGKKTAYITQEVCFGNKLYAIIDKQGLLNGKYLFYYTRYNQFYDQFKSLPASLMGGVNNKNFGNICIPVPPLTEQQRIVNRIEEMFSQLDAGVETLKKTKAQLAVYRQAVLKEAFSSYHATKTVEISEIVDDIRIGPFGTMLHKSDYIINGTPVINPQHIKGGKVIPTSSISVSDEKAKELSAYMLKTNDIIMGRRGEMGRTAAITDVENGWICGTGSILFRLKSAFDSTFYAKILSSPDVVHYLEEHATGTTMKNLNEDIVQHIPVPFVTAEMQKKITMNIDRKMSVCDSIEQTVNTTLQQAEAMRQSILKDAFEGRL